MQSLETRLFERLSVSIRRSARIVVKSPNAVHSVLYRVVVFFNASIRIFLLQVEFRARILRVVYVGAIAVLFRFVVMMLNLSETTSIFSTPTNQMENRGEELGVRLFGTFIRRIGLYPIYSLNQDAFVNRHFNSINVVNTVNPNINSEGFQTLYLNWVNILDSMWGMSVFGQVLYTDGLLYVVGAGMVLLVAIIGSIVLTLKVRTFARAKRQHVDQQRSRDADAAVMLVHNKKM